MRRVEIRARAEGGEIDNSQLSRYERGRCYPSFDKLCILANIFNVSVQNFSDVLEMERYDEYKPSPELGFEELQSRGNAELEAGNFGRAYVAFESALQAVESTLGLRAKISLVEPNTIERSQGKAKRLIDKRVLK